MGTWSGNVFWLTVLKYLKIAAVFCRQHWRWVVGIVAFIVVYSLGRKGAKGVRIQAELARKQYKREKEAIEKAHELEIKKREQAEKNYSDAVRKIEEKYEKDKLNITRTKKEDIKKLVRDAKNNPDEIDRILEHELGIKKL
tara:strand:+ start:1007 stop:1429 length:423 start_codon:yes stop_codon:yes gene_type:complete